FSNSFFANTLAVDGSRSRTASALLFGGRTLARGDVMRRIDIIAFAAAALAYATPAVAQGKGKGRASQRSATVDRTTGDIFGTTRTSGHDKVPPGHLPPAGLCRVWIDGVPPGHQPPVTNCATAQIQRTANSRVIYGDDTPFPGKGHSTSTADGRV